MYIENSASVFVSLVTTLFTTRSDTIVGFSTTPPCVSPSKCLIGEGGEVLAFNTSRCEALSCGLCPQGMYNDTSMGSCVSCAKGTFNDETNQLACKPCIKGKYSDQVAQSGCKDCGTGNYCPSEGEEMATKCPIGSYSDETTANACKVCPGGKYQVKMHQTFCNGICASGKYLPSSPDFTDHDAKDDCKGCPQGKYGPAPGAEECFPCAAGKWSNKTNQTDSTTCTPCPTGTVTAHYGSTKEAECKVCDPGTLPNNLQTDCVPCDPGTFLNATALNCQLCQCGFYSLSGATACTMCRPGTFAHAMGSSTCSLCPSGRFSPLSQATNASACKDCPTGTFSAFPGADSISMCYKCAPGKYNPLKGGNTSSSCIPCLAGQVSLEFGASKCTHCPNGTLPNARNSDCNPCPAGTYLDAISRNCTECPKGRFSPSSGNAVCLPCKRGTYADYSQAVTCAHVPPGSVSLNCTTDFTACSEVGACPEGFKCNDTTGIDRPFQCPRGRYSLRGSIACTECPPGKYGAIPGICKNCKVGRYSGAYGLLSCKTCKDGQYSIVIPRVRCEDNEFVGRKPNILTVLSKKSNELYIAWRLPYANSTLLRVVVRLKNFGDSSSVDNIHYIVDPSGTSATIQTPEPVSRKVYKIDIQILYENQLVSPTATYSTVWATTRVCLMDSFYLNASSPDVNDWKCASCPSGASCKGLITWSGVKAQFGYWRHGRKFYKCLNPAACMGAKNIEFADRYPTLDHDHAETCNMPFGFANFSRLCARCKPGYVRGTARGSCNVCDVTTTVWELGLAGVLGTAVTLALVEVTVFRPRTFRVSNGVKKIALSYLQMATLATKVNIPWTKSFGSVFAVQAVATSIADAFLSIDCLLPAWSTWDVFQLKLGCLLLFPVLIAPLAFVGVLCRRRKMDHADHLPARNYFVSAMVLLLYLLYPALAKKVTDLFTCTVDIDGTAYLQLDPSVPCWQGSHLTWVLSGGAVGVLVYLLGLPLAGYRTLRSVSNLSDRTVRLQYGILYDGYRDEFWWWEITVVWRKILIVGIGAMIEGTQQILAVLLVVASLMFLTAICQPFVNEQLLRLELMSLSLCFFTFWIGSMLVTDPHGGEGPGGAFMFGLAAWSVAALNVIGGFALFYTFATSYWKEKGRALMNWACGQLPTICIRGKKRRGRRDSKMELYSALDYNAMDDDQE